ncbi:ABC transporter ATP-binding protein [Legionella sp.]|uniref:ABC transporter ATP-binding protein n=1 Tax=Legionella sp. TaxID=459 RepID=UPI003D0ADA0B
MSREKMIDFIDRPLIIVAKNVGKQVLVHSKTLTILHNVSLKIHAGETIAICGPSGVGKSTLLALLAGLDNPSSGKIYLSGYDLATLGEREKSKLRSKEISFIFQGFYLLPMLNAIENVTLPLEIQGIKKPEAMAKHILEQVGLSDRLHHYPNQLSGGEQQRVAIARAYVTQPKILFADEITANLDEKNGFLISDLVFKLNQEFKTTLIIVTHDSKLAGRCQRKFTIVNGCLHEY